MLHTSISLFGKSCVINNLTGQGGKILTPCVAVALLEANIIDKNNVDKMHGK